MDEKNAAVTLPKVAKMFYEHIRENVYVFADEQTASVMEAIYTIYANNLGGDPENIKQIFADLEEYLCKLGWEQNNELFALICTLCNHYEERAFKDGLQLGAQLILELQDK